MKIAIVGATGLVGSVMLKILEERNFPVDELKTFRKLNTRLQGHPTTHEGLPGVRIASGSLDMAISIIMSTYLLINFLVSISFSSFSTEMKYIPVFKF